MFFDVTNIQMKSEFELKIHKMKTLLIFLSLITNFSLSSQPNHGLLEKDISEHTTKNLNETIKQDIIKVCYHMIIIKPARIDQKMIKIPLLE